LTQRVLPPEKRRRANHRHPNASYFSTKPVASYRRRRVVALQGTGGCEPDSALLGGLAPSRLDGEARPRRVGQACALVRFCRLLPRFCDPGKARRGGLGWRL
jgi:hypothetical protein